MFDLLLNSSKISAKFGLSVTLFVLLAACSHKKVNNEDADLNPIPANAVVDSEYSPSASGDAPTPQSPANSAHRKSKKKKHFAAHKVNKSNKGALAMGRVNSKPPTAPPPVEIMTSPVASQIALTAPVAPASPILLAAETTSSSSRGWLIWLLVSGSAASVVLGYRVSQKSKKGRRLIFNS